MRRTKLTGSELDLAALLLGGIPGCRGIAATGIVVPSEAAVAYEWLGWLAQTCTPSDQGAIDRLYFAISLVEGCEPEAANEVALAA